MMTRSLQGDTVDMVAYRHFGSTAGITEQLLELNPGLAELGEMLPENTPINLPESKSVARETQPLIQLWD